jgi:hypothetical protein
MERINSKGNERLLRKFILGATLSIKKNCHAGHQKYCGHWFEKTNEKCRTKNI